jgi:transposase
MPPGGSSPPGGNHRTGSSDESSAVWVKGTFVMCSDNRTYRRFTAKQKLEVVLASLRGDRTVAELCREHGIAESLLRKWRERALEAAAERFESGQDRSLQAEQRRRIAQLERALGRKTYELEIAADALRGP